MSALRERLERDSIPEPNSGCLLWKRAALKAGYGRLIWQGKIRSAHRLSWEEANGREPAPGMDICHKCDVSACINPAHLFEGSRRDNLDDMTRKGRRASHPRTGLIGAANPAAKLSEEAIRCIKTDTRKQAEIAAEFGISFQQVSKIKRGSRWGHV